MDTVVIFCALDDFCQWFEPWWEQRLLELAPKRRQRRGGLCLRNYLKTPKLPYHCCQLT
jgi:hypothetical protein